MHYLCFSVLVDFLYFHKHRDCGGQRRFALDLLMAIAPDIGANQSEETMGYFLRRSREVSKSICRHIDIMSMKDCTIGISEFAEFNLSGDILAIKNELKDLIKHSRNIHKSDRTQLIDVIDKSRNYNFIKEILVFVLKNTTNMKSDFKRLSIDKLKKEIINTDNNAKLERLCLVALDMREENLVHLCLEKMGNNVHISRLVQYLIDLEFDNDKLVEDIADRLIFRLDNNVYIEKVIRAYIAKKSFSQEAKQLFLEKHISQLDNNKYLFSVLKFLWEEDFTDEVRKYGELLTNTTYIKRLDALTKNE